MKFAVIKNKEGLFLVREYSKEWEYSTMTGGGSEFSNEFIPMKWAVNNDKESSLVIFESIEKAQKFIENTCYRPEDYTAMLISDITEKDFNHTANMARKD